MPTVEGILPSLVFDALPPDSLYEAAGYLDYVTSLVLVRASSTTQAWGVQLSD